MIKISRKIDFVVFFVLSAIGFITFAMLFLGELSETTFVRILGPSTIVAGFYIIFRKRVK